MAKVNERDRNKYGVCTNRDKDGKPCPKCETKEVQKIRMGQDFVCEECKEAIRQVPPPKQSTPMGKIIAVIVAAILVIGGGIAAYIFFGQAGHQLIPVSSISLEKTSVMLGEGEKISLETSILPADATDKTTMWSSSDPAVAIVNDGTVTALKIGTALITAETRDGSSLSAGCEVIVQNAVLETPAEDPKEDPKKENPQTTSSQQSPTAASPAAEKVISVNGGSYIGQTKGGKPHGQGTLTFSSRTRISKKDRKERYAEAKQYIIGEFHEGELVHGTLYDTSNSPVEQIRIGR